LKLGLTPRSRVIATADAASLEAEMIAEAEFDLAMGELTMMPPL
jgi:hypothetical protein